MRVLWQPTAYNNVHQRRHISLIPSTSNARVVQLHNVRSITGYIRHGAQIACAPSNAANQNTTSEEAILKSFQKVQNGSDVRGITLDIVPDEKITLTPVMMYHIASSFADWLSNKYTTPTDTLSVSVGADPRLSSPILSSSMVAGLASRGVSVGAFGLSTTPAMFMSCILPGHEYTGAIMITASHLPVNRNGAKFFTADGGLDKPDIKWMLDRAAQLFMAHQEQQLLFLPLDPFMGTASVLENALSVTPSLIKHLDFIPVYADHLRKLIIEAVNHPDHREKPLLGMKILVNAGNGGGGFLATQVLEPLGADIHGSTLLKPNGHFPVHPSNPEDKVAVETTRQAVSEAGADLGLMFDTDVDRSGVVDMNGKGINRNRYIALMAAITLREHPGQTVVTDSCTSNGLADFISALGGKHFRFKKGYKNIINKGVELNNNGIACPLMMETSGHGAMKENYFLDDGAYAAMKIVIEAVRRRVEGAGDLSDLLNDLKEPTEAMEIRVKITADDVKSEGDKVTAAFHDWVMSGASGAPHWAMEKENYEGWRVSIDEGNGLNGWLLVRPSLHDPDVVINVESEVQGGMKSSLKHLLKFFDENKGRFDVNTAQVESYVNS